MFIEGATELGLQFDGLTSEPVNLEIGVCLLHEYSIDYKSAYKHFDSIDP
jgi:hypothetical protein